MEIVFSMCLKHLKDKTSEYLHVAEKVSIVWVCVTLCLISAHIQIINIVMTLQLVVFLFTLVYTHVGCVSGVYPPPSPAPLPWALMLGSFSPLG